MTIFPCLLVRKKELYERRGPKVISVHEDHKVIKGISDESVETNEEKEND